MDGAAEARDCAGRLARRPVGDEVCRDHEISETLYYSWRDKLLEGGRAELAGTEERTGEKELRRRVGELERLVKTYELGTWRVVMRRCERTLDPTPRLAIRIRA